MSPHHRRARWAIAVDRLRKLRLLNAGDPREPGALDAHPIVRAHFGSRLQHRAPEAFREAHSRLYDFYRYQGLPQAFRTPIAYALLADQCAFPDYGARRTVDDLLSGQMNEATKANTAKPLVEATPNELREAAALIGTAAFDEALRKFQPGDLGGMRPCFSAIAHGCAAGRHQEAYREVYFPRVQRGNEAFINSKLGALNADLAALASFFDKIWSAPAEGLREQTKARVLNYAAFALRALGRLREAVEPFEACLEADAATRDWKNAAIAAGNVSELRLTLGDIAEAIAAARRSVAHADDSGDAFMRLYNRTTLADAMHQAGQAREASKLFEEAEAMQAKLQPSLPKLYSMQGYRYCDILLAQGHTQAVKDRASHNLQMAIAHEFLLDIALDNLSLGRADASLRAERTNPGPHAKPWIASASRPRKDGTDDDAGRARLHLDGAVEGLRRSSEEIWISRGLLARAAFRRAMGAFEDAAVDLDEAHDIAARGEMRLHLADFHLESARLALARLAPAAPQPASRRTLRQRIFGAAPAEAAPAPEPVLPPAEAQALRASAREHYAEAKKLIGDTGYKRRLPELDAIRACLDGAIPAAMLDPDRDREGRPAAAV
jgi:tetratricopeptide (TPR) repeat protein